LHHNHISALTTHHSHHHYIPTSLTAHNHASTQTDWAQYSLRQTYKKAGGILYKQSVLTPTEFTAVQMAIEQLNLKLTEEKESSFATNRIGAVIEKESDVYKILSCDEGSLCRLANGLAYGDDVDNDDGSNEKEEDLGKMILSPDIPIEVSHHNTIATDGEIIIVQLTTTISHAYFRFESTKKQKLAWNGTLTTSFIKTQNRSRWCLHWKILPIVVPCGDRMINLSWQQYRQQHHLNKKTR
jgi:hypothetical protein